MKQIRCFSDCKAQWTGDPKDCDCAREYDARLEDAEEDRYQRWKDRD